jgi:hypothetical protein
MAAYKSSVFKIFIVKVRVLYVPGGLSAQDPLII